MSSIWIIVTVWLYTLLITVVGRWGERYFTQPPGVRSPTVSWAGVITHLAATLLFLVMLPAAVLSLFGPLLPFQGAQAGLALAIVVVLFGLVPARLLDSSRTGWEYAFWALFIDLLRVGGALTLVGWLLN